MTTDAGSEPLTAGQRASRTDTVTSGSILEFANVTGDRNPIHVDEAAAAESMFGRRIAHGMLIASRISALLAEDLPGPGTVYLGQELSFRKPVFIDDEVTSTVELVEEIKPSIWRLRTWCENADGDVVIEGVATVKVFG